METWDTPYRGNRTIVKRKRSKDFLGLLIIFFAKKEFAIDEAKETLSTENHFNKTLVDSQTEFFAHCSNMQAWIDYSCDTRLMHSNISFPLLRRLSDIGDSMGAKAFKNEVALRFNSGYSPVMNYLVDGGYLYDFTEEELDALRFNNLKKL